MAEEDSKNVFLGEGAGENLLKRLFRETVALGEQITLLLISSLQDIDILSKNDPDLMKKAVSNIILQGGYTSSGENLKPDLTAANNRFHEEAAITFHTFISVSQIEATVYTKAAAFEAPLSSAVFAELGETEHLVGEHLRAVQVQQDLAFYKKASSDDPEARYASFMDQRWFLLNKTAWFQTEHPLGTPYPEGEEVIPYLTRITVYDALAALGTAGKDTLDALQVLNESEVAGTTTHRIVGTGICQQQMILTISALLRCGIKTSKDASDAWKQQLITKC